jgi:hypothetical protein
LIAGVAINMLAAGLPPPAFSGSPRGPHPQLTAAAVPEHYALASSLRHPHSAVHADLISVTPARSSPHRRADHRPCLPAPPGWRLRCGRTPGRDLPYLGDPVALAGVLITGFVRAAGAFFSIAGPASATT